MPAIPGEFLAIDRKARARVPSLEVATRPISERVCDFHDVVIPMDAEQAMLEAARCVHCPDPAPCVEACPAHNDIPSAMWMIENGEFLEAARIYRQTSSLPEICGRVCPQEQLCQGSCTHLKSFEPVLTSQASVASMSASAVPPVWPVLFKPQSWLKLGSLGALAMTCAAGATATSSICSR